MKKENILIMKRSLLAFLACAITACQISEFKDQDLLSRVELSSENFITTNEQNSYSIENPINYQKEIDFVAQKQSEKIIRQ